MEKIGGRNLGRKEQTEAEINKLIMVDESGRGSHELSVEVLLTEIARSLAVMADSLSAKEKTDD